jgi:hypothetical protein
MLISDMIGQLGGQNINGSGKKITSASSGAKGSVKSGDTSMSSLKSGDVFEGNISDIHGDKVTLSLSNGKTMTARIEGDVALNKGQSVFFEVKSNDGGTVKITPMLNGDYGNPILSDALKNAGLPITDSNLTLVKEMMNNGLPIGADNLSRFGRLVNANSSADISTIIKMDRMGVKITPDNISNFTRLEENNNALFKEADNITSSFLKLFDDAGMSGNSIVDFENKILSTFTSLNNDSSSMADIQSMDKSIDNQSEPAADNLLPNGTQIEDDTVIQQNTDVEVSLKQDIAEKSSASVDQNINVKTDSLEELNIDPGKIGAFDQSKDEKTDVVAESNYDSKNVTASDQDAMNLADKNGISKDQNNAGQNLTMEVQTTEHIETGKNIQISKDMTRLSNELLKLPGFLDANTDLFDENNVLKSSVTEKEFLSAAISFFENNPEVAKNHAKSFFTDKSYNNILSDIIKGDWSLKPEQVSSKETIKELYKNIEKQLDSIDKAAKAFSNNSNSVSDTVNSAKSNVDFMNQINQLYSYVQIPLKMMNQNATGDLYVYTGKKKSGNKGNDSLSAFLHLSLNNLGNVDVSVKLNKKIADVRFYLDNDASYKLVIDNKEMLVERLLKKGYTSKIEVSEETQPENYVEKFLKDNSAAQSNGEIKRFSFDVRA